MRDPLLTDTPRARATDPESSHEAADRIKRTGRLSLHQRQALEAVRKWPGRTAAELAENGRRYNAGNGRPRFLTDRYELSRRLPELAPVHAVQSEGKRPCKVLGSNCVTWAPVAREQAA